MVDVATRLGPLQTRVIQRDADVRPALAVVLCHGFGASGTDLVPLGHELLARAPSLGDSVRLIFPAAPFALEGFGGEARAWWPINFEDAVALRASGPQGRATMRARVPEGLVQARRQLAACVEAVGQTSGLPMGRVV